MDTWAWAVLITFWVALAVSGVAIVVAQYRAHREGRNRDLSG